MSPHQAARHRLAVALAHVLDGFLPERPEVCNALAVAMVRELDRAGRALAFARDLAAGVVPPAIFLSPGGET